MRQRVHQIGVALIGGAGITQAIGGAQHQGFGTAGHGVGNHVAGLGRPGVVKLLEALQRVDGTNDQAVRVGNGAYVLARSAVHHLHTGQVVADFNRMHAQALGQGREFGKANARCTDAVDGKLDALAHGENLRCGWNWALL